MSRLSASVWLDGFAVGAASAEGAAFGAGARSVPRRTFLAALSVLAFAAAFAVAGLRPESAPEPPSPSGLDGFGSCLAWASQLNGDVERAWSRCGGSNVSESRRGVREAIASADRAFADYAEATHDALKCSKSHVPAGCDAGRLLRARQAAASAQTLVEKRISDARHTLEPVRP